MKTKQFNLEEALKGAKVVTRDGREVSQLTKFDIDTNYLLFGVIKERNGINILAKWTNDGSYYTTSESKHDLFLAFEPKSIWANIHINDKGYPYVKDHFKTECDAKDFGITQFDYLKTIEITNEPNDTPI